MSAFVTSTARWSIVVLFIAHMAQAQSSPDDYESPSTATLSSEEIFDPSQQPSSYELLNGLLNTQTYSVATPNSEATIATELAADDSETTIASATRSTSVPQTRGPSAAVFNATTTATASTTAADENPSATTIENSDDLLQNEPLAQPRTQTVDQALQSPAAEEPAAAEPTQSTTAAILTSLSSFFTATTADEADETVGAQREAKNIDEPLNDEPMDSEELADSVPYAAGLTLDKSDKSVRTTQYDDTAPSEHNSLDFSSSSLATESSIESRSIAGSYGASTSAPPLLVYPPVGVDVPDSVVYERSSTVTAPAANTKTTATPSSPTTTTVTVSHRTVPKIEVASEGVNDVLRRHVYESHLRSPLAVLVDATPSVLRKTRTLWSATLKPQPNLDVILMTFNMSGIGVTYKFNNTRTLFAGLDSLQDSRDEPGATFFGLVRSTKLIPYDSAIFVCTDRPPFDAKIGKFAAMTLLKKRIRVFLIWFGSPVPAGQTEGGLLGELALQSGGDILRVTDEELELIKLYEHNDVLDYSQTHSASRTTPNLLKRIREDLDEAQPTGEITVAAIARTARLPRMATNDSSAEENEIYEDNSWLEFNERHRRPKSARLVRDELELDDADNREDDGNIETQPANGDDGVPRVNVRFPDIQSPAADDDATRMNRNTLQAATTVQMGIQSQLLPSPGGSVQLYFEVTNRRDQATLYNFQVSDEQRYLQTLSPLSAWLAAGQTTTAVVTARVPPNTEIGQKDRITFTAQGIAGLATQTAQLTVSGGASAPQQDTRQPTLYWSWGSRCDWKTGPGQCASAVWSLELTAQDADTGLLRLASRPAGLVVRNAYTAGTNGEVRATYTASCCSTRVTISAADLAGNQRTVTLDVRDIVLNEATIAAIAVGVILLILLIVLVVVLIVWCCRRRRESRDLELFRARSAGQQQAERTNNDR